MKCKYCKIDMVKGIAIDPSEKENMRYFCMQNNLIHQPLLIEVYKCPKCGHSDDNKRYGDK